MNEKQFNKEINSRDYVDFEALRIEQLINEHEDYENNFFSIEDILKSDEIELKISQFDSMITDEELCLAFYDLEDNPEVLHNPFEYEDFILKERDEQLIKEKENYELNFIGNVPEDFNLNDLPDSAVRAMEEAELNKIEEFEFDFFEYESSQDYFSESSSCDCPYLDYMPIDSGLNDYLDCYDYPEGPQENLSGVKYF